MANSLSIRTKLARWRVHRELVRRLGFGKPFYGRGRERVLFISYNHGIAHAQIFPFFFYRRELRERYGVELSEVKLDAFREGRYLRQQADIVFLQTSFDIGHEALERVLEQIQREIRPRRVIFGDWYAPSDLRLASRLGDRVNRYFKKHVLRDRSEYGRPTRGDTTLMEYYAKLFGLELPEVTYPVPEGFLDKLVLGPGFNVTPTLVPALSGSSPVGGRRDIDLHARVGVKGIDWYQKMRGLAVEAVKKLDGVNAVWEVGVPRRQFFTELRRSKLCFSPFGYGEVAWRDCEAISYGAMVLKPDMSHLEFSPELFVPYETYVPVAWDFSDLEEKVRYYLENERERERIAENAFEVARSYLFERRFVTQVASLFV